jgi:hypothetical protein
MVHPQSFLFGRLLRNNISLLENLKELSKSTLFLMKIESDSKNKQKYIKDFLINFKKINHELSELIKIYNDIRGKTCLTEDIYLDVNVIKKIIISGDVNDIKCIKIDTIINEKINKLDGIHNKITGIYGVYDFKLLPRWVRPRFKEVIDVYSIGYFDNSILVLGKIIEKLITDLLFFYNKSKKIKLSKNKIDSMTFQNKIEYLESKKKISRSDASKIKSIKWDRNIGGHPSDNEDIKKLTEDVESLIEIGYNQIISLSKKLYL